MSVELAANLGIQLSATRLIIGGRSVVRAEGVEVGAERTILTAEDVKLCFTS